MYVTQPCRKLCTPRGLTLPPKSRSRMPFEAHTIQAAEFHKLPISELTHHYGSLIFRWCRRRISDTGKLSTPSWRISAAGARMFGGLGEQLHRKCNQESRLNDDLERRGNSYEDMWCGREGRRGSRREVINIPMCACFRVTSCPRAHGCLDHGGFAGGYGEWRVPEAWLPVKLCMHMAPVNLRLPQGQVLPSSRKGRRAKRHP